MKQRFSIQLNKWIAGFAAVLFFASQPQIVFAAAALPSAAPSNFEVQSSKNNALPSVIGEQNKTFSMPAYDLETGALISLKQFEVIKNSENHSGAVNYRLMNEIYFNDLGQTKYVLSYEGSDTVSRLDYNYRPDGVLLRVDSRGENDLSIPVESATYFKGEKGSELPVYVVEFDADGTILSVRFISFDEKTGALTRVDQKQDVTSNAAMIQQTFFGKVAGKEEAIRVLDYSNGGDFNNRQDYIYEEAGNLSHVQVRSSNDASAPLDQALFFDGSKGNETPLYALTFDALGNVTGRQDFVIESAGSLSRQDEGKSGSAVIPASSNSTHFINRLSNEFVLNGMDTAAAQNLRNRFAFDLQGVCSQIITRAGPASLANAFEKGAIS